jgi:hypothetical protein
LSFSFVVLFLGREKSKGKNIFTIVWEQRKEYDLVVEINMCDYT